MTLLYNKVYLTIKYTFRGGAMAALATVKMAALDSNIEMKIG